MDDSSKFAMRKLSEVVRELRGNGSHVALPAIRPVLGALLDDGEFEDFDSMLEAGQEDPETLGELRILQACFPSRSLTAPVFCLTWIIGVALNGRVERGKGVELRG